MGRPLAQSPLHRPAAAGRPGQQMHRQASVQPGSPAPQHAGNGAGRAQQIAPSAQSSNQQFRSHGDATGGQHRPHRQTRMARPNDPRNDVKRRRTNVLFVLVVATACSMFLAATTGSTALLYVFALSFLALCGYVYLLAQLRQRDQVGSSVAGQYAPQYQPQYTGQVHGQPYGRSDYR